MRLRACLTIFAHEGDTLLVQRKMSNNYRLKPDAYQIVSVSLKDESAASSTLRGRASGVTLSRRT